MSNESLTEVAAKLKEYHQQLADVELMILSSPTDQSLQQLKIDINQLITITQDLARGMVKKAVPPPLPSSSQPPPLPTQRIYKPSDRIMARYSDNHYYPARIDSIDDTNTTTTYIITYLDAEYGTQETIAEQYIKPYIQVDPNLLRTNTTIRAIWAGDGLFYDAIVEGPSTSQPQHWKIKYTKYKKKGEVHLYDIQMKQESSSSAPIKKELDEKLVIPDKLKIDWEHDSEQVQIKKKAQIKRLKADHRRSFLEQEGNKRKNSWLDFQKSHIVSKDGSASVNKKKRKVGLHMVEKKSMFASPDEVEGKVGVVGSGKKMTEYTLPKQHAFGDSSTSSLTLPNHDDDGPPPLP